MNTNNIDTMLSLRESRRFKADERYMDKMDKAMHQVGYLVRDGKTVCYIFPIGGKYREGQLGDLTDFLIRNRYV